MSNDHQLRVDMLHCDAYGYCAELLPEIVELDEWGYPIVTGEVTPDLLQDARRAAAACPKLALRLEHLRREPVRRLEVREEPSRERAPNR